MTYSHDDAGDILHSLTFLPARIAENLARELQRTRVIEQPSAPPRVPAWCRSPVLRGFVVGNALAAPLLLLLWALAR